VSGAVQLLPGILPEKHFLLVARSVARESYRKPAGRTTALDEPD
jgi:thioredoxin-related protein